jgi:hypothetical protein
MLVFLILFWGRAVHAVSMNRILMMQNEEKMSSVDVVSRLT